MMEMFAATASMKYWGRLVSNMARRKARVRRSRWGNSVSTYLSTERASRNQTSYMFPTSGELVAPGRQLCWG